MKPKLNFILILFVVFLFTTCNGKQKNETKSTTLEVQNFDWLLGRWKRVNEEKGKETFEYWKKINQYQYKGIGFTLQRNDTISQEIMKLLKSDGKWNLIVKIPQEPEAVTFEMSNFSNVDFECKNNTLDFPKNIKYWKEGTKLKALVAGDSLKIPFEFEKIKE